MKIKAKYRRMSEVYTLFSNEWDGLDFSPSALEEMFLYESMGVPIQTKMNGYFYGKQWMDVHLAMWKEDIQSGILRIEELYDGKLPKWWLDKNFKES
jgi:hypothetical protein